MDVLPIPDRPDYAAGVKLYENKGYVVLGLCPECEWGLLVHKDDSRTYCTAYGQCEYAPG
jgi:hypothetical protein